MPAPEKLHCLLPISSIISHGLQAFGAALAEAEAGRRRLVALDCGAGVGRVTEQLLLQHFAEVDLVEPSGESMWQCRQLRCIESPSLVAAAAVMRAGFYCACANCALQLTCWRRRGSGWAGGRSRACPAATPLLTSFR